MRSVLIPERPGAGRLGRHVEHDPQSRAFGVSVTMRAPLVRRSWPLRGKPLNQKKLGSCTTNALCHARNAMAKAPARVLVEADAIELYKAATLLDTVPGAYPPHDTGSSGLAACKAAVAAGELGSYQHAFAVGDALSSISVVGPIIIGVNWYEGFDEPQGQRAELVISGSVRGGHEIALLEIDPVARLVRGPNSWGPDFGDHGWFTMSFATLERLLSEDGDATIPLA